MLSAVVHMWRPEDDLWEVVLFFHPDGLHRWKSRLNKVLLQASLGYDWTITLALVHCFPEHSSLRNNNKNCIALL